MIKFIIPTVIIFLIILFWEKITETVYKKAEEEMDTGPKEN